jgi:hypothetical protein
VTPNETAITVIPGSGTKVYDGTPLTKTELDDFTVTGVPEGFTWAATADGTVTNVVPGEGEKAVNAVTNFQIFNADSVDVTEYFTNINTDSTGTLTITPVQDEIVVTIVGNNQSDQYDGQSHTITGYEITNISNALYTIDDFTMPAQDAAVATATRTYVGTTTMELSADDFANTSANFDSVRFEVTPGYQTITFICEKIVLNSANTEWVEDFENITDITGLWTGVTPYCWTIAEQYTNASLNEIGDQIDTMPQVYHSFNTTPGGHYSLRMHFRSLLAMPELDENVDLANVRLSMYVRQSYWRYKLQIGVITDIDNPEESFVPVAVVNNPNKNKTYFECGFWSVKDLLGPGRYIAFKNIGGSEGDPYCVNYLDDITLTYVECGITEQDLAYSETFEGLTELTGATGVEPDCWDLIAEDTPLESTTKPQLYHSFNTTEDGSYSLRMWNRCIYAMPELIGIDVADLTMTLNLRQPNSLYRLQVGVVDNQGNFMPVKTLKCNGTSMQPKTVNFAHYQGNGHRIAFRNILVPGTRMSTDYFDYSINYIDDILLFRTEGAKMDANVENFTEDLNVYSSDIEVYPNPTTGKLYIDAVGIQKVECYNQMGQLVRMFDNVTNNIDLSNLADGIYTLRISAPQGVTLRKVVKR